MLHSTKIRVKENHASTEAHGYFLCIPFVLYVGNRVSHVFQKTAWILVVIAITMFGRVIAIKWTLSKKNAEKAVDAAR